MTLKDILEKVDTFNDIYIAVAGIEREYAVYDVQEDDGEVIAEIVWNDMPNDTQRFFKVNASEIEIERIEFDKQHGVVWLTTLEMGD